MKHIRRRNGCEKIAEISFKKIQDKSTKIKLADSLDNFDIIKSRETAQHENFKNYDRIK